MFEVAVDQYGYVTTGDVRDLGLRPEHLVDLARRGQADHVSHGLYRLRAVPASARDQLMEATLWPRGLGVISHDTALDLWGLCPVHPLKVHVTVPESARIRRRVPAAYVVHRRDLEPGEITRVEGIPVVSVYRAIRDGIERHLGSDLIRKAITVGRRTGQLTRAQASELSRIDAAA